MVTLKLYHFLGKSSSETKWNKKIEKLQKYIKDNNIIDEVIYLVLVR